MSKRRHMGMDRVFLNCAVCHSSTVRAWIPTEHWSSLWMQTRSTDGVQFMGRCVGRPSLHAESDHPAHPGGGAKTSTLDRLVVYPLAVHLMRDGVPGGLLGRMRFITFSRTGGRGVSTFQLSQGAVQLPDRSAATTAGGSSFPDHGTGEKQGMQLHWDGNNDRVEERNLNASFGTGATPA